MFSRYCLVAFIVASTVGWVASQNNCRQVKAMENFDAKKVAGLWYGFAISDQQRASKRCASFDMTGDKGKQPDSVVTIESWKEGNALKQFKFDAVLVKNATYFKVFFPGNKSTYAYPLAADYDRFVTWYLCQPDHPQQGVVFILTKKRQIDDSHFKKAQETLSKAGFLTSPENLLRIDQTACD